MQPLLDDPDTSVVEFLTLVEDELDQMSRLWLK